MLQSDSALNITCQCILKNVSQFISDLAQKKLAIHSDNVHVHEDKSTHM